MAISTASIVIKPTVAFNRNDTFFSGSWVCTTNGARSFQCYLTMTQGMETGLVALLEVITGPLVEKVGEFSLYTQVDDFKIGSASNSNSMSPWIKPCKPALEPSCDTVLLHEHFPYGLCNSSRAHAEALTARQAGKEIISEYSSDSNTIPDYNSDSSYEFDFGLDPIEPKSELNPIEEPLSGPATGLVITSTPVGRFVYWPDRRPADLTNDNSRCIAYLETFPLREGTPRTPAEEDHTPTEVATNDSGLCTPDHKVFMAAEEARTSENRVDWYLDDISVDKESANAPQDETIEAKNAWCERSRRRAGRRR
jgi:hypothetical protein